MIVPKNMFVIWIGNKPAPLHLINTWKEKHPDWKFRIIDNDEFYGTKWQNQSLIDVYLSENRYPGVADVIRYELLFREGGFSPPADSLCLHNVEELMDDNNEAYGVYENEKVRAGLVSPLYACVKNSSFAFDLINNLPKIPPKINGRSKAPWQVTGNLYMKKMIEEKKPSKLTIWESFRFNPIHHTGLRYEGNEKVYAVQQWGATSEAGIGIGKYEWGTNK